MRPVLGAECCCRACGWPLESPGWVGDIPTATICDCCGAESGIDDATPESARAYRRTWVEHGAEWFDPGCRPDTWDLYEHLSALTRV